MMARLLGNCLPWTPVFQLSLDQNMTPLQSIYSAHSVGFVGLMLVLHLVDL
jgi:hypothetical protein